MKKVSMIRNLIGLLALVLIVTGCANKSSPTGKVTTNQGRYKVVKDYGPDSVVDVSHVKNAVPVEEPLSRGGNRSRYEVLGKHYSVMKSSAGYKERGGASWYGKKFHGYLTANGEKYDMYGMSAAHKSLPIPTFVKVTNLANNRHVIVRVNDRGPFHKGRIIDLSYAAASKLGMLNKGTAQVEVEAIDPKTWNRSQSKGKSKQQFVLAKKVKPNVVDNLKTVTTDSSQVAVNATATKLAAAKKVEQATPKAALTKTAKVARSDKYLDIHYIQVGVYSTEKAAHDVTLKVKHFELPVLITDIQRTSKRLYKVIMGPVKSRSRTEEIKVELAQLGFEGAHLIDLPK